MKILFSGASSFTAFWMIRELVIAGHSVTAAFDKYLHKYEGVQRERVEWLSSLCHPAFNCSFGSEGFLDLISRENHWDLFCHNDSDDIGVTDVSDVLRASTYNIASTINALRNKGCNRIIFAGSYSEPREGSGSDRELPLDPKGLAKSFSYETFKYFTNDRNIRLGKYVLPSCFGPHEDYSALTSQLASSWLQGHTPSLPNGTFLRDFLHVGLMAKSYLTFVKELPDEEGIYPFNPSGYVESIANFVSRFSYEMHKRLSIPCEYVLEEEDESWDEPKARYNNDPLQAGKWNWDESIAWDHLADYYKKEFSVSETQVTEGSDVFSNV